MKGIKCRLDSLISDDEMLAIVDTINTSYRALTFKEKEKLFTKYNNLINKHLRSGLNIHINKNGKKHNEYTDVFLSDFYDELVLDGTDKNPYVYLEDILFYHLVSLNELNYDYINIGNINFDTDYTNKYRYIASYSKDNIRYKELIKEAFDSLLVDCDKEYKKEYDNYLFNKRLTKEVKQEFEMANELLDEYIKKGTYDLLLKIDKLIDNRLSKEIIDDKEILSLYAIDNILLSCLTRNCNKKNIEINLNKFISEFFGEFKDHLQINFNGENIKIDNIKYDEEGIFLDELFEVMSNINRLYGIIDNAVSADMLNNYEKKLNKKLSNEEVYFYSKLEILDSYLKNKDLEIINYTSFTEIFKFNDDVDIYIDKNRVFNEIFFDDEFMSTVDRFLSSKNDGNELLFDIVNIMNKYYYDANFKLIINEDFDVNETMGESLDNLIYINVRNCGTKLDMLETLFHEYRHLMQMRELKDNHDIYNDTLYEYVKLNYSDSPFEFSYSYATIGALGYQNDIIYDLQPIEFDAENFAKYMIVNIDKQFKNRNYLQDCYFNDFYSKKYTYFSNKKISLKYYEQWYELNGIREIIEKEEKEYKEFLDDFKHLKEVDLAKLFKKDNFDGLDWIYIKEFYTELLIDKSALVLKDKENVKINNKTFNIKEVDYFTLLEEVLVNNAYYLAREGKISLANINNYIFNEALKFKLDIADLNETNLFTVYMWHSKFSKYDSRKKINKIGRRK